MRQGGEKRPDSSTDDDSNSEKSQEHIQVDSMCRTFYEKHR